MEMSLTRKDFIWLGLLVLISAVHGLLYAFLIPPWQAPDEDAHFVASYMYAYTGRLPTQADVPEILIKNVSDDLLSRNFNLIRGRPFNARWDDYNYMSRTVERYSPAYALYGLAIWPFLEQSVIFQFYIMRLVSVGISVAIIGVVYLSLRLVWPDSFEIAIGSAVFLIFWPQYAFIASSISDGNLAVLFSTLTFYSIISIFRRGLSPSRLLLSISSFFVALISKNTTYFLAPLIGILVGDYLLRSGFFKRFRLVGSFGWLKLVALVLFCVCWGWLLVYRLSLFQLILSSSNMIKLSLERLLSGSLVDFLDLLFESFWLILGWMNIRLDDVFYQIFFAFSMLMVGSWIVRGRRIYMNANNSFIVSFLELSFVLNLLMIVILMLIFVRGADYRQGRFLFATNFPFSLVFTGGWLGLFTNATRGFGLKTWFVLWILVDAGILFNFILLRFYPIPFSQ